MLIITHPPPLLEKLFKSTSGMKLKGKGVVNTMETNSPSTINCKGVLLIFIHGLTGDKGEHGLFTNFASRIKKKGVETWRFDMPGSGHRKGEPITASSWIKEVSVAVDKARAEGYNKVVLLGLTLGGYVALEVAKKKPINGLVLWAPLTNSMNRKEILSKEELAILERDSRIIVKGHTLPKELFEEIEKIKQGSLMEGLSIPIFIAHGTEDKTIPWQMSKRGAKLSGATLYLIEEAGHGFRNHEEELYSATERWLLLEVCKP